jgi:hypothetical protein
MAKAPESLTTRLSSAHATQVSEWWMRLTTGDRRALRELDAAGARPRALQLMGRFVQPGEDVESGELTSDLYEYIVNHELAFLPERTFHICSAHPEARAAIAARRIPAAFTCPLASTECPMRALLDRAPGHDVRLAGDGARTGARA